MTEVALASKTFLGPHIEGIGERTPDAVGDPVAEDQPQHDQRAPAQTAHQLHQRREDGVIETVAQSADLCGRGGGGFATAPDQRPRQTRRQQP